MKEFLYKKKDGITALSARFTDFHYKKHSHKEYAVGVTLKGIQKYCLDGCQQLSYPSGIMLFNPEQPHDGMAKDNNLLDYVMLYIEPELLHKILNKKKNMAFSSPIIYNDNIQSKIIDLASSVLHDRDELLFHEQLISLSESLFPSLIGNEEKRDDLRIIKAKEMIHSSLNSIISLDDISRELGISKFQFIRMFNNSTGISPYQYYLSCKVASAKQIIEATGDIYLAVAECNFVDLTHLNKHFKSIYGITANQYVTILSDK